MQATQGLLQAADNFFKQGKKNEAVEYFKKAIPTAKEDPASLYQAYMGISLSLEFPDQASQIKAYTYGALKISKVTFGEKDSRTVQALLRMIHTWIFFEEMGEVNQAVKTLLDAHPEEKTKKWLETTVKLSNTFFDVIPARVPLNPEEEKQAQDRVKGILSTAATLKDKKAKERYQEAVTLAKQKLEPNDWLIARSLIGLASLHKGKKAIPLYEETKGLCLFHDQRPELCNVYLAEGKNYHKRGYLEEARKNANEALKICSQEKKLEEQKVEVEKLLKSLKA